MRKPRWPLRASPADRALRLQVTLLGALLCSACAPGSASASTDILRLSTGEELRVSNVVSANGRIEFDHPVLGRLSIPAENASVVGAGGHSPATAAAADAFDPAGASAHHPARQKARQEAIAKADEAFDRALRDKDERVRLNSASFFEGWRGSVEFGASGSDGNTDAFSGRVGIAAARLAELMETRADAAYAYAADNGRASKSRGEANVLNDWLFRNQRWGFFAKGKAEFDEFQDWTWRLSGFAGPSYTFLTHDQTTLRGRAAAGGTKEIGGSRNEISPEGLLGLDWTRKLTDRQSLFLTAEYLPSLSEPPRFRANLRAGYSVLLDPSNGLSLKMGIEDRYDSDPAGDAKRNDLDVFAGIRFDF